MNAKRILIILIIIGCIGTAFYSMRGMMTPYVAFADAIASREYVQVIGSLNTSRPVEHREGFFNFSIKDTDGAMLQVRYTGTKPLNFEHAQSIVALGSYNTGTKLFEADKLLVKCPSKYQKEKTK